MKQERRALRLAVRELRWQREATDLHIAFRLSRGSFATTVLREILADTAGGDE
jgi:tRNA pseudouridine13 synthase